MEQFLNKVVDFATHAGLKLVVSAVVLFLCSKGISLLIRRLKSGKGLAHMDPSVRSFLISALNIVLRLVLLVTVASYLGLPMTSVVTVIGSAGVAIGLALQGGLSNIASGMMILFFRPFSVEDYIEVNGQEGTVTAIGIFHTVLRTYDNRRVVIPNSVLTGNTVLNLTAEPTRRIDLELSAGYGCDSRLVRETVLAAAARVPGTLTDPAPSVVMTGHGDNALLYKAFVWCNTADYWTVRFALLEEIKRRFDEQGIEIPFPQLDVHLDGDR